MYTMLDLKVRLKKETPSDVVDTLARMAGDGADELPGRAGWMFHSHSAYLDDQYEKRSTFDADGMVLDVGFDVKNYSGEIEWFLKWLSPWVDAVMHGWYAYEEDEAISAVVVRDGVLTVDYDSTKPMRRDP